MALFTVHGTDGSQRKVQARRVSQIGDRLVFRDESWKTVCDLPIDEVAEVRRRVVEHNGLERSVIAQYPVIQIGETR